MDTSSPYAFLKYLQELKRIAGGEEAFLNTSKLEQDFLNFSRFLPKKQLSVRVPKIYKMGDDEKKRVAEILAQEKISAKPEEIDISGGFDYSEGMDLIILLSLKQFDAEHFSRTRSYLNPLIEKIYGEGARTIRDFTINEAVYGRVVCKRGELNLREARLFPERFKTGPYTLETELDTSQETMREFSELTDLIEGFKQDKASILDAKKVEDVTRRAVELRKRLGSLSRYENPRTRKFSVETDSCIVKNGKATFFFLYSRSQEKNVLVYFGECPFAEDSKPKKLMVLDGADYQGTLQKLVELDIFKPSYPVLAQRIRDLTALCDDASRYSGSVCNKGDMKDMIEGLKKAEAYFKCVFDEEMKKNFVLKQPLELVEFMVYPYFDEPVIHELLPRMSWNKTMRMYHDAPAFISEFERADEKARGEMLMSMAASINFSNQQNNDVNVWLYREYREFCESNGINFQVAE